MITVAKMHFAQRFYWNGKNVATNTELMNFPAQQAKPDRIKLGAFVCFAVWPLTSFDIQRMFNINIIWSPIAQHMYFMLAWFRFNHVLKTNMFGNSYICSSGRSEKNKMLIFYQLHNLKNNRYAFKQIELSFRLNFRLESIDCFLFCSFAQKKLFEGRAKTV